MFYSNYDTDIAEEQKVDVLTDLEKTYHIVVWNADVNTFDWVIETLIDICGHTEEQAEQCALLIHTQGKYAVQQGTYTKLKPKTEAIVDRGINATLEVLTR